MAALQLERPSHGRTDRLAQPTAARIINQNNLTPKALYICSDYSGTADGLQCT